MTTMTNVGLPINLKDLILSVEDSRVEFKAGWDDRIKNNVIHTIAAYANDYLNLNGGYVILGIESSIEKGPILPPKGIVEERMEAIQRDIRVACKVNIEPEYYPLSFVAEYEGRMILIIWCPGGDSRPYSARKNIDEKGSERIFYIRIGPETLVPNDSQRRDLLEAASKIPFDDRRNHESSIDDLSPLLVKRFLQNIGSNLVMENGTPPHEVFRKMKLTIKVNDHEVPRNIGLMFFNDEPDRFFEGAKLELVQFVQEGDVISEKVFRGPLNIQIKQVLDYLSTLGGTLLEKVPGRAEVERTVPYPYEAMEESIVNALYHRGYDTSKEPVKIYLYPDRMEIISYPGPVPGIRRENFPTSIPPVPARNRRVGEFLKDLRLAEGRGTGIPKISRKMRENGSPDPVFDFDDDRTYFRVILSVHPRYRVLNDIREAELKWAKGEREHAIVKLRRAFENIPSSGALASRIIDYASEISDDKLIRDVFDRFTRQEHHTETTRPYLSLVRYLINSGKDQEAESVLDSMPTSIGKDERIEIAVMKSRSNRLKDAHLLFSELMVDYPDDPKIVHEFAQVKMKMTRIERNRQVKDRLNREAQDLLRRAISLSRDDVRTAWCWNDLAMVSDWLRDPHEDVELAFEKALEILPDEDRIREKLDRYRNRRSRNETGYRSK